MRQLFKIEKTEEFLQEIFDLEYIQDKTKIRQVINSTLDRLSKAERSNLIIELRNRHKNLEDNYYTSEKGKVL